MTEVKSVSELKEAIDKIPYLIRVSLKNATYNYYDSTDYNSQRNAKSLIDDILYEYRWDFIDHSTDSELIHDETHLEEFIDNVYRIYWS